MELNDLFWLSGSWICKSEKYETEEMWQKPKANLMLGLNRTVSKEGKNAFEFLRIFQQGNDIFYAASPNGKPATLFKLVDQSDNRVVFENLNHDFPQRIVYHLLEENELSAIIEGNIDDALRWKEWRFRKV